MTNDESTAPSPAAPMAAKSSRRRECRAAAVQFLYMWDANPGQDRAAAFLEFFGAQEHPREHYAFAEELVQGTLDHQAEIDELIKKNAINWAFNRIARVDLAILRLGIYELLHRRDIPPVVTINEAIELGKSFSNPDSRRFLNGILDKVKDSLNRPARTAAE